MDRDALEVAPDGTLTMDSLPLYKYLGVEWARLTLTNQTFKHAKPSDFYDLEELTIRSIFPGDDASALRELEAGFTDVLLAHLDDQPTSLNVDLREKVSMLLGIFRSNPEAARLVKEKKASGPVSKGILSFSYFAQ